MSAVGRDYEAQLSCDGSETRMHHIKLMGEPTASRIHLSDEYGISTAGGELSMTDFKPIFRPLKF